MPRFDDFIKAVRDPMSEVHGLFAEHLKANPHLGRRFMNIFTGGPLTEHYGKDASFFDPEIISRLGKVYRRLIGKMIDRDPDFQPTTLLVPEELTLFTDFINQLNWQVQREFASLFDKDGVITEDMMQLFKITKDTFKDPKSIAAIVATLGAEWSTASAAAKEEYAFRLLATKIIMTHLIRALYGNITSSDVVVGAMVSMSTTVNPKTNKNINLAGVMGALANLINLEQHEELLHHACLQAAKSNIEHLLSIGKGAVDKSKNSVLRSYYEVVSQIFISLKQSDSNTLMFIDVMLQQTDDTLKQCQSSSAVVTNLTAIKENLQVVRQLIFLDQIPKLLPQADAKLDDAHQPLPPLPAGVDTTGPLLAVLGGSVPPASQALPPLPPTPGPTSGDQKGSSFTPPLPPLPTSAAEQHSSDRYSSTTPNPARQ